MTLRSWADCSWPAVTARRSRLFARVRFRYDAARFPDTLSVSHTDMQLRFSFSRPVHLRDLRFPFPLVWTADRGTHAISGTAGAALLAPGVDWPVAAETLFSMKIAPGVQGVASGMLALDCPGDAYAHEPDWRALRRAYAAHDVPFGRVLAQQMFRHPSWPWRLADTAAALGVETRSLQMRLFREAYSFAAALKRCRMLRVLLAGLSGDAPVPVPQAWAHARAGQIDSMFAHAFDTPLSTIERSRVPARHAAFPIGNENPRRSAGTTAIGRAARLKRDLPHDDRESAGVMIGNT